MKLRMKLTSTVAVFCAAITSATFTATPAQAWVWDSHVRIAGQAFCKNGPYAASSPASRITIRMRATGETRTVSVNWLGYYGADFYTVPVAGSWADEYIQCPFDGPNAPMRYGRAAFMYRPSFGTDIVGYNMTS
jgi:hypothetical protein